MDIFYYNTQIYREILLQLLQFTEKYYVNRTLFHFRRRADAVLRRAARLSKAFSTARPSRPNNSFIHLSEVCYMKKVWHTIAQHGVYNRPNKCFTIQILIKLHVNMPTNDFFLIMHFGNPKNKNKTLKSKKSNECFAKQISTKMHA